jgi:hypothetical protein
MFTYEYVLAAVLITAPADTYTPSDVKGWFEPLQSSLVRVALEAEILDGREVRFVAAAAQDFAGDLKLLQGRFRDLGHAPLLEECQRFPERQMVMDFLAFNRAYRHDLTTQLGLDLIHAEELRLAVMETDRLHNVWDTLRDARCEYYYITVRRQSLHVLRELIGYQAFYTGQLPPHVPVWRFAETK